MKPGRRDRSVRVSVPSGGAWFSPLAGGAVMTPLRVAHCAAGRSALPTGGPFTHGDEIVVQSPAGAAAVAMDDARLYDQASRRERWLRATAEVTAELLSGTDPDAVLQLIAGRVGELTGADWTLIAVPRTRTRPGRSVS